MSEELAKLWEKKRKEARKTDEEVRKAWENLLHSYDKYYLCLTIVISSLGSAITFYYF